MPLAVFYLLLGSLASCPCILVPYTVQVNVFIDMRNLKSIIKMLATIGGCPELKGGTVERGGLPQTWIIGATDKGSAISPRHADSRSLAQPQNEELPVQSHYHTVAA